MTIYPHRRTDHTTMSQQSVAVGVRTAPHAQSCRCAQHARHGPGDSIRFPRRVVGAEKGAQGPRTCSAPAPSGCTLSRRRKLVLARRRKADAIGSRPLPGSAGGGAAPAARSCCWAAPGSAACDGACALAPEAPEEGAVSPACIGNCADINISKENCYVEGYLGLAAMHILWQCARSDSAGGVGDSAHECRYQHRAAGLPGDARWRKAQAQV